MIYYLLFDGIRIEDGNNLVAVYNAVIIIKSVMVSAKIPKNICNV